MLFQLANSITETQVPSLKLTARIIKLTKQILVNTLPYVG